MAVPQELITLSDIFCNLMIFEQPVPTKLRNELLGSHTNFSSIRKPFGSFVEACTNEVIMCSLLSDIVKGEGIKSPEEFARAIYERKMDDLIHAYYKGKETQYYEEFVLRGLYICDDKWVRNGGRMEEKNPAPVEVEDPEPPQAEPSEDGPELEAVGAENPYYYVDIHGLTWAFANAPI